MSCQTSGASCVFRPNPECLQPWNQNNSNSNKKQKKKKKKQKKRKKKKQKQKQKQKEEKKKTYTTWYPVTYLHTTVVHRAPHCVGRRPPGSCTLPMNQRSHAVV